MDRNPRTQRITKPGFARLAFLLVVLGIAVVGGFLLRKNDQPTGIRADNNESGRQNMALIPAGVYRMGSEKGDRDELPVHDVYVDSFWIDRFEVTNLQYREFVRQTDQPVPNVPTGQQATWNLWDRDGFGEKKRNIPPHGFESHPVVGVTWSDARAYCDWVGKRLPTEAEWERACRGGLSDAAFPWGDQVSVSNANFRGNTLGRTVPAISYSPNGFGVYQISGNVWEWVGDFYEEFYYVGSPTENPRGPATGSDRIVRGGSAFNVASELRCANRRSRKPGARSSYIGFRCVKD